MTPVSVVIPCFNQARFLDDAIQSVASQSDPTAQIVVVDDGSTDDTAMVARRHAGVEYLYQRNSGLAAARNAGLRRSAGQYVVFLDADDRLLPGALGAGVVCLEASPDAALAVGRYRHIDAAGTRVSPDSNPCPDDDLYLNLLRSNCIGMVASVMFRRQAIEQMHGFDSRLRACEDYDLYLRLARQFASSAHQSVVAEYRLHSGAMSRDPALMLSTGSTVLKRQRRHARRSSTLRAAWRDGVSWIQRAYGEQLLDELRSRPPASLSVRIGRIAIALRYYPRGLIRRYMSSLRALLEQSLDQRDA